MPRIEIVEPTLASEAGHCAALFLGLRAAAPELAFRVWIDRLAKLPGWSVAAPGPFMAGQADGAATGDAKGDTQSDAQSDTQSDARAVTQLVPHFHRRWRKLQAMLLYRRLLRAGQAVLVPTASYFDLRALDLAAGGRIAPHRVFLYFHKLRVDAARARALAALARRQPDIELFGTSEEIVARLRGAGFTQVRRVLPVLAGATAAAGDASVDLTGFRTLLSAGAARADKGFSHIVEFIEWLQRTGATLPIAVQTSGDHYGRHDERTAADLARLRACGYAHLDLIDDTLDGTQYARLFPGTICLQPYVRAEYADKMSAVTFDALRAGAPIITLTGTTMAGIVAQNGAGIVIEEASPQALFDACEAIIGGYAGYQARALAGSLKFSISSSWQPMVERLQMAVAERSVRTRR